MMKTTALVGLVLAIGFPLSACGSEDPASGTSMLDLTGQTFIGDSVTVDDEPYPLAPGSTIRLTFDEARIGAHAGCNTMSGGASWSDGTLVLDGGLASTEMACEPALMDQDTWLIDVLTASPTLALDGSTLTVSSDTTVITLTDEQIAVPDASLTGTAWRLESIATGPAVSSVPTGVKAIVAFGDDGSVHATLGCNIGNGPYTVDGDRLQIGPLATTRKACGPDATEVESVMLSVLDGETGYAIDGDQLTLTPDVEGSMVGGPSALTFGAVDRPSEG